MHAYVLLFLPACHSRLRTYVYRVPGLVRACTVHSCVTREGFRLRVNLQKTRVHGCAHAIRAILNASTMLASIKFKSSCTVGYLYCKFGGATLQHQRVTVHSMFQISISRNTKQGRRKR